MQTKIGSASDDFSCSKRSKRLPNLTNSQEFEKIDSLNASFDTGKIRSVLIPNQNPENVGKDRRRDETYFEKIKNLGTNLKFNLEILGETIWRSDENRKHKAYLLGKAYEVDKVDDLKRMKKDFSSIIWFSYRKNFPKLNYKLLPQSESYVSDTGWGCMIRVCQMIFAECLRRHRQERKSHEEKEKEINHGDSRDLDKQDCNTENFELISWFLDSELDPKISPYSIQNISVYLQERFKLKPGIWLKPSSVLFALQEIHKDFGELTTPGLQVEVYIESTIYVVQALKKVAYLDTSSDNSFDRAFAQEFEVIESNGEEEHNEENGQDEDPTTNQKEDDNEIENKSDSSLESVYISDAREIDRLLRHKWRDSLIVFILAKIGLDRPNPQYIPFIKDLLSYEESVGMIGGKPGLAFYIVGYIEDKLMYLDPHFVQESVQNKESLKENMHTYNTNLIKHVNFNDIDTSVTFGFFIKDEKHFKSFIDRFRESCKINESFLGIELNGPQENTTDVESVCEEDEDGKKQKDEDGFEMI